MLTFFGAGGRSISEYLKLQFDARMGNVELFLAEHPPGFARKMFSREHFLE